MRVPYPGRIEIRSVRFLGERKTGEKSSEQGKKQRHKRSHHCAIFAHGVLFLHKHTNKTMLIAQRKSAVYIYSVLTRNTYLETIKV